MQFDYYCVALVVLVLFFLYIDNSNNLEGFASLEEAHKTDTDLPAVVTAPVKQYVKPAQEIEAIGAKPTKLIQQPPPSMLNGLSLLESNTKSISSLDYAFAPILSETIIAKQVPSDIISIGARVGGQGNLGEPSIGSVGGPARPPLTGNDVVGYPVLDVSFVGAPLNYGMETKAIRASGNVPNAQGSMPYMGKVPQPKVPQPKVSQPKELEVHMVYTNWCGHSKRALPHFDKAAAELDGKQLGDYTIKFTKTDADTPEGKIVAKENNVKGFPTHVLKVDGKNVAGNVGRTYEELVSKVKSITN